MARYYDDFQPELWLDNSLKKVDINKLKMGIWANANQLLDGFREYLIEALKYTVSESDAKIFLTNGNLPNESVDEQQRIKIYESLGKRENESLFDAYKKTVVVYLIEDIHVHPAYKREMLKNTDRIPILSKIIQNKETDNLENFVNRRMKTYTPQEIASFEPDRQARSLTEQEKNYLLDKLAYANIWFYEMCQYDKYFESCVSKLADGSQEPGDHIYMHMWERRVSGKYKTQEQHQETINMVIEMLNDEELAVLNKFSTSLFGTQWNHFINSDDGILLHAKLRSYFEKKYASENRPWELPLDIDNTNKGKNSIYGHLKDIFPDKTRSEIENIYSIITREDFI